MPMSVEELEAIFRKGIRFGVADLGYTNNEGVVIDGQHNPAFYVLFQTKNYKNAKGENQLRFIVELLSDGHVLRLSCPSALNAAGGDEEIYLASCIALQSKSVFFRFVYDEIHSVVAPRVEIAVPEEKGLLTQEDIYLPMRLTLEALDKHYEALEATKQTGKVLAVD